MVGQKKRVGVKFEDCFGPVHHGFVMDNENIPVVSMILVVTALF